MQTMNLKFCLAILCCLLVGLEGMKRHGNQRDEERRKLESLRKGIKNLDGNISVIKPWLIMLGNDNARGRVSFQKMCIEAIQKGDIESLKKWADKIKNGKKQPKKVEQTGMNDKAKGRKQKQKKDEIGNVAQNEDRVQNVEEKMEKVEEEEDAESEHEEFEVVEGFDEIVNDLHTADKRNILLLREILLINHNCAKNVVDACSGAVKKIEEFLKNVEEIQEQALAAQQSAKNGANSIWLSNSDEVNVDIL